MGSRFILSGAGTNLTWFRNWLPARFAMPRTTIFTTTTARRNLRSDARYAATCFRLTRDSAKTRNQSTSAPTAILRSFAGKCEKRLRSTNAVLMTARIASRRLQNSIRLNGHYRRSEARSSNSAISTGSIITNPKNLFTQNLKSRSSRLRRSTTLRTSLA